MNCRVINFQIKGDDRGSLICFVWVEMFDFSPDCVLMVLSDAYYDETGYIKDYEVFLTEVAKFKNRNK